MAPPGKNFHYSDTGHNLLGKILEATTGKPFQEHLRPEIFDPLWMDCTDFLSYDDPREPTSYPMANTCLGDYEVSTYRSISVDWAGGGIVSTTEDLLRFHETLVNHTLISEQTFALCSSGSGDQTSEVNGYLIVTGFCQPASRLARMHDKATQSEAMYRLMVTLAFACFLTILIYPVYYLYHLGKFYLMVCPGMVMASTILYLAAVCPACDTRYVCPWDRLSVNERRRSDEE